MKNLPLYGFTTIKINATDLNYGTKPNMIRVTAKKKNTPDIISYEEMSVLERQHIQHIMHLLRRFHWNIPEMESYIKKSYLLERLNEQHQDLRDQIYMIEHMQRMERMEAERQRNEKGRNKWAEYAQFDKQTEQWMGNYKSQKQYWNEMKKGKKWKL